MDDNKEDEYADGIKIDVDDIVIEANSHVIDAKGRTRIFEIYVGVMLLLTILHSKCVFELM